MKKIIQKWLSVFLVLVVLLVNLPLVYAQEFVNSYALSQAQARYQQLKQEADQNTVQPVEIDKQEEKTSQSSEVQEQIKAPEVIEEKTEKALEEQYGKPIVESGYTSIYQKDEKHYITVLTNEAKTYEDEKGNEKVVDLNLVSQDKGFSPASSPVEVSLPEQVNEKSPIEVGFKNQQVKLYSLDHDLDKPVVKDNAVLYNNVEGQTDVQYTVSDNGIKEEIVLEQYEGKSVFQYGIEAKGLSIENVENKVVVKNEKGKALFVLSAPMMVDAKKETSNSIELSYQDGKIVLKADEAWLKDEKRAYPVRIDPTITVTRQQMIEFIPASNTGHIYADNIGLAGFLTNYDVGGPDYPGRTRMYFRINYDFRNAIPNEAKITKATFNVYQYQDAFGRSNATFGAYRVLNDYPTNRPLEWTDAIRLSDTVASEHPYSHTQIGFHRFDVREAVNQWVQGLAPNYGLVIKATDENATGGAFYTVYSGSGQYGFSEDKAPRLEIEWSVPDPVDVNFPLDGTTVNLRPMTLGDRSGLRQFQGVFVDGISTPGAMVAYVLNDESKGYGGLAGASYSYRYPNNETMLSAYPEGTTKYKDKLANWQSADAFSGAEHNVLYHVKVQATKNGQASSEKKSNDFLIYPVTQFDTLPKIANYYGVSLDQISYDNRIQDMLLVKNNTLFIQNPTRNTNRPYNPPALDDSLKRQVDGLLMGRGLHCEFNFEPINVNTGNFYLERVDVTMKNGTDDFGLVRSYNAQLASLNGSFGRGWSFDYDEQLSQDEHQNLLYRRSDGSIVVFTKEGDHYVAPTGISLTLTVVEEDEKEGEFGVYRPVHYEIKEADDTVKTFSYDGRLVKITNDRQQVTTLTYNAQGQLESVRSSYGLTLCFVYNEQGLIGRVQLPNGGNIQYRYDEQGHLIESVDANGGLIQYQYDEQDRMVSWTDQDGVVQVQNTYDEQNRVTQQVDANGGVATLAYENGRTITTDQRGVQTIYEVDGDYRTKRIQYSDGTSRQFTYNEANQLASVTDELGHTTHYAYDQMGQLIKETRFDGATKHLVYDGNLLVSETGFDGKKTEYAYQNRDLVKLTRPDGSIESYEYNGQHELIRQINARGFSTYYAYQNGNIISITDALGNVTSFEYDAHHQLTSMTNAKSGVWTNTYDLEGRQLSWQDADGVRMSFAYNGAGDVTSLTDGNGHVTSFGYDGLGHRVSATIGQSTFRYEFDPVGNEISEIKPDGQKVIKEYDSRSRLTKETDEAGNETTYEYDGLSRLVKKTLPNGGQYQYAYDDRFNQIRQQTNPEGGTRSYEYDASGNLIRETDELKQSTSYKYDVLNHLIQKTSPNGLQEQYEVDRMGNRTRLINGLGTTTYEYDELNRLVKEIAPDQTEIGYAYDALSNVTAITNQRGMRTQYTYTKASRLSTITDALGQVSSIGYDGAGHEASYTDASGHTQQVVYNEWDEVSQVVDALGNPTQFKYNGSGQLAQVIDALGYHQDYTYDDRGLLSIHQDANQNRTKLAYTKTKQLKKAHYADGSEVIYHYDLLDRVTKEEWSNGLVTQYEYDALSRLVSKQDNQGLNERYTYDASDQLVSMTNSLNQKTDYQYDEFGRLIAIHYPDGTQEKYVYDVVNQVIQKTDREGHQTKYAYDEGGNLIRETDHLNRQKQIRYDKLDREIERISATGRRQKTEYDVLGNVSKEIDASGHELLYGYDASGNLISMTDAKGSETVFKYDALNRLVESASPTGIHELAQYDGNRNIISYTNGENATTKFEYDNMDRMVSLTKPTGGQIHYAYDESGALASETDPNGHMTKYENDLYGRLVKKVLANQAKYTYSYDGLSRLVKQTGPKGLSQTYEYDVAGNLVKQTDQSGRVNTFSYDVGGRVLSMTNPLNLTTHYTYDQAGQLESLKTPMGYQTHFDYNQEDELTTIRMASGRQVKMKLNSLGQVVEASVNGKRKTSFSYDANGNLTEVINPLKQSLRYAYDKDNRLIGQTDTAGHQTHYEYDKANHLTRVSDETGAFSRLNYDANGNVVQVQEGHLRVKNFEYDLADQLIKVQSGDVSVSYGYNEVGQVTSIIDGKGHTTRYTYDQLGNVTSRVSEMGQKEKYTYDQENRLASITRPDGRQIHYDYNQLDQLLTKRYSTKDEGQVVYGYDADGRRVQMDDLTGLSQYTYDADGQLTGVQLGDGSFIQYKYDEFGNLSQLTYPDGRKVKYRYDELDRLIEVKDGSKTTNYTYDQAGDLIQVKRADGSMSYLSYDKAHRTKSVVNKDKDGNLISSYDYTYDDGGTIESETIHEPDTDVKQEYTYDQAGQLIKMKVTSQDQKVTTLSYTYDGAGNKEKVVIEKEGKEEVRHLSYDANNRLIQVEDSKGTTTYTYDANGNRISKRSVDDELSYVFDTENRLLAVKDQKGLLMAALYDGDNNRVFTAHRIEKTRTYRLFKPQRQNGVNTGLENGFDFFWYGFTQGIAQSLSAIPETVGNAWQEIFGTLSESFHKEILKDRASKEGLVVNPPSLGNQPGEGIVSYASEAREALLPYTTKQDRYYSYEVTNYLNDVSQEHTQVLQTTNESGQVKASYTYGVDRVSINQAGKDSYYWYDGRQNVVGLSEQGELTNQYHYLPYGNSEASLDGQPYRYASEARDHTGLDYLRARYYDPEVGSFISQDSIQGQVGDPLSHNLYTYVENDPINFNDPSGFRRKNKGRSKADQNAFYDNYTQRQMTRNAQIRRQQQQAKIAQQRAQAQYNAKLYAIAPDLMMSSRPLTRSQSKMLRDKGYITEKQHRQNCEKADKYAVQEIRRLQSQYNKYASYPLGVYSSPEQRYIYQHYSNFPYTSNNVLSGISTTSSLTVMTAEGAFSIENASLLKGDFNKESIKVFGELAREEDDFVKLAMRADKAINGSPEIILDALKNTNGLSAAERLKSVFSVKALGAIPLASSALDGLIVYNERRKKYGDLSAAIDGVAHGSITLGATTLGGVIGSSIPIVGTAVGMFVGWLVGTVATYAYDEWAH